MANGRVYIVGPFPKGPMKIGVTETKEIRFRLNNLQLGYPGKLHCYGEHPCAVPWQVEMKAHAILQHRKVYGEWFDVTNKEATEAIQFAIATPLTVTQISEDIGKQVGLSVKTLYAYLGRREVAQYAAKRRAKRKGKTT